jgi:tRNA(Ile)-lysidine synthase
VSVDLVAQLAARCRFPDRHHLCCAVSGGPDSLGLLVLAAASGRAVTAIHVDHGLRPGSDREAEVVATAAARFGAAFVARRVEVGHGPNLEARAREARRAVLPPDVLWGHTADDQAETVLLQLLRGAGPAGLAAMSSEHRPMLALRRAELRMLCDTVGLRPIHDPSNDDPSILRNRVRHEVLPLLAEVSRRDPVPLLARAAAHQRRVTDLLATLVAEVDPTSAAVLTRLPDLVAAEAVRRWWRDVTGSAYAPDEAAVGRVLGVARGEHRATEVAGGWRVERSRGRLRLVAPGPAASSDPAPGRRADGAGGRSR